MRTADCAGCDSNPMQRWGSYRMEGISETFRPCRTTYQRVREKVKTCRSASTEYR
jgi:hypothetical protein